jgi:hypothetical protein
MIEQVVLLIDEAEAKPTWFPDWKPKTEQVKIIQPKPKILTDYDIDRQAREIRERLNAKFKDDKETHPEMWDKNWINKGEENANKSN